ncbi:MAG: PAS domain S-box protein [Armatimonadetes bacterium]|nr:PAS domain S-box protein [Anaerolineae bacterium]
MEFPVEVSVELVRDADGNPIHIQSLLRDITERKQIEQQLAYQASLLQNVSDAIISTSMNNVIQSWNAAAEKVYGWKASEVIGKKLAEVVPTEFASDSEDFIKQQYIVRGHWRSEVRQRARDGRRLTMLSSVSILRGSSNELIGTVTINHDITARKQAETELQARVVQLASLRQVDVEITSSLKLDDVLQVALNAAHLLSGADDGYILLHEADEMVVRQVVGRYQEQLTPSEPMTPVGIIQRAILAQEPQLIANTAASPDYVPHLPGTQAQIVFPLMSQDRMIGVLNLETAAHDVFTPQKFDFLRILVWRISVALENAQLYQVSGLRLAELQVLYDQVKTLEALKTDMIRMASHDLRNPVGIVKGYLEIMGEDLRGRATPAEFEYMETMRRSIQRMQNILNDILSVQRIEEMAQHPSGEMVDLVLMTGKALSDTEESAQRKAQTVKADITSAQCFIEADGAQIHEAMVNLMDNASKYTPERGCVDVRLRREGDTIIFEVQDNGYGIPLEMQARLFEPFYRAKSKETRDIEGTGLGLHLVKNIIDRHHGTMLFKSEYGKGSLFGFTLPAFPGT